MREKEIEREREKGERKRPRLCPAVKSWLVGLVTATERILMSINGPQCSSGSFRPPILSSW